MASQLTPVVPDSYPIGVGDLLHVIVFGRPELTGFFRVSASGAIRMPYGHTEIEAVGSTAAGLDQAIAQALVKDALVAHPDVVVQVTAIESKPIVVMGAVKKPLTLEANRPMRLLEVLSQAEGVSADAGGQILITRYGPAGPETRQLALAQVLSNPAANPELYGGEEVLVLPGGRVYVVGAVTQPGGFPVEETDPLTTLKAVALARGWTVTASPDRAIVVRTLANGQRQEIPVNLSGIIHRTRPDMPLLANDILYIPDNNTKRAGLTALSRALEALTYAGGLILAR